MDSFFNKEFYINLAVTILLTIAAIVSGFRFDLMVIAGTAWGFFTVIHVIKLSAAVKDIRIEDIQSSNIVGK